MLRCGRANRPKPEPSVGSLGLCTQKALLESCSENESGKTLTGLVAVDSMRPEKLINPGTWISEPQAIFQCSDPLSLPIDGSGEI